MKIFFTGGGGFVGREIIPLLKKNNLGTKLLLHDLEN